MNGLCTICNIGDRYSMWSLLIRTWQIFLLWVHISLINLRNCLVIWSYDFEIRNIFITQQKGSNYNTVWHKIINSISYIAFYLTLTVNKLKSCAVNKSNFFLVYFNIIFWQFVYNIHMYLQTSMDDFNVEKQ